MSTIINKVHEHFLLMDNHSHSNMIREANDHAQTLMEFERLIPVMTPDELAQLERMLTGQQEAAFSHDTLTKMDERANEREKEINAKFAAAAAKSDELCRQKTARK